jgi:hypothetical protein
MKKWDAGFPCPFMAGGRSVPAPASKAAAKPSRDSPYAAYVVISHRTGFNHGTQKTASSDQVARTSQDPVICSTGCRNRRLSAVQLLQPALPFRPSRLPSRKIEESPLNESLQQIWLLSWIVVGMSVAAASWMDANGITQSGAIGYHASGMASASESGRPSPVSRRRARRQFAREISVQ